MTGFRDITFLAAGPASERSRSAAEAETRMNGFLATLLFVQVPVVPAPAPRPRSAIPSIIPTLKWLGNFGRESQELQEDIEYIARQSDTIIWPAVTKDEGCMISFRSRKEA